MPGLLISRPVGRFSYSISRWLARGIFGLLGPVRLLHPERAQRAGGYLLAANHISHFDPPFISAIARRPVDWMAMSELFHRRWARLFLLAVGAFPTDRSRVDRRAVRTALDRLGKGRVVGIFPEGGIRAGATSILGGAPMRPGAATLAQLAGVPIIPCVVLGTDRLYNKRYWKPRRRARFWAAFGEPLVERPGLPRAEAREQLERDLVAAFHALYRELQDAFALTPGDLPHTPQERQREKEATP